MTRAHRSAAGSLGSPERSGGSTRPRRRLDPGRPGQPGAAEAEQGGQQGERGEQHHGDRRGGGDGDPVQQCLAQDQQAEHPDHHRDARHEHRPARGAHRRHRGGLGGGARPQPFPEPGDDEQRVVDADPEADQPGDDRGERRRGEDVAEQPDQRQARADAEQRRRYRQPHGEQRAEGDQQDDRGGDNADAVGRAAVRRLFLVDHVAAEAERHAVTRGGPGVIHQRGGLAGGDTGSRDAELHGRERDVPVAGYLSRGGVRVADRGDVGRPLERDEGAGDLSLDGWRRNRCRGLDREGERIA